VLICFAAQQRAFLHISRSSEAQDGMNFLKKGAQSICTASRRAVSVVCGEYFRVVLL
jgi:hypothetical protein